MASKGFFPPWIRINPAHCSNAFGPSFATFNNCLRSANVPFSSLYIPVLVKKLMDVECSVKVVNGAAGYDSATDGNATLNSFGENYTAHISYTYKWMVSEWQSMLENGDSLLWNFDKTVKLGSFGTLDRSKIHLTLVDMNTQGTQTSYHQSTLE